MSGLVKRRLPRIGGPSEGADRMVTTALRLGKRGYISLGEVPA